MKELCGEYMPFPSIPLSENKSDWNRISLNDYFDLLKKIRHNEKNLNNNLDRIPMIYSHVLENINT